MRMLNAGVTLPCVPYAQPNSFGMKNAPYAAIAAVNPVTSEECTGLLKTNGIIRKHAALMKPVEKKSTRNDPKKSGKLCDWMPMTVAMQATSIRMSE